MAHPRDNAVVPKGTEPDDPSRSAFIRKTARIAGVATLAGGVGATSGCAALKEWLGGAAEEATEGAIQGADNWVEANPEAKAYLDERLSQIAEVTSNLETGSREFLELQEQIKELTDEENAERVEETLENLRQSSRDLRDIMDVLGDMADLINNFRDNITALTNIFIYFLSQLVKLVTDVVAEFIACLLYVMFKRILDRIIDNLSRTYWFLRWLRAIF